MEGLEVSEVLLSNLEYSGRIDSEYYKKHYLNYEETIMQKNGVELGGLSDFLIGPFGSSFTVDNYTSDTSYRYVRGKDVKPLRLMDDDNAYMPKEDYERLKRYALRENDVLVSVVGTLGNAALVTKKDLPAIFSCKSTALRPHSINPVYLLVYVNSKYGKELLLRKERGAIQKGLNLDDLRTLLVYPPSRIFQNKIEEIFNYSFESNELGKSKYIEAEEKLLQTLHLDNFNPGKEKVNTKSFSDSFGSSGRLDAEYYQPKYDEILSKLENYKLNNLGKIIIKIDTGEYSPEYYEKDFKDNLTFYIRSTNIKNGSIIFDDNYYVPKKDFVRIAKKGDIVTARVGSIGVFGEIRNELEGAVYSDNVLCFRLPNEFIPSVYTLLFNTSIYFDLINRLARGSVQQRLNQETLKELEFPLIPLNMQKEIAELIEESFSLKEQSEKLLELAKTAVEKAIEEDEGTAMNFINDSLKHRL